MMINTFADSIENQITLVENPAFTAIRNYPLKLDAVYCVICINGTLSGTLNLNNFTAAAPCFFIVLPGQILQINKVSDDFRGLTIILSKRFWDGFPFDNNLEFPLFHSIHDNPFIPLKKEELETMSDYFRLMQNTIRKKENQNRSEAIKHLTVAFFYGFGYQYHQVPENIHISKQDILLRRFLLLARENYRNHRAVDFYADKLCLSPKYLSKMLKQKSGKTVAEWIEDHVILEAKALLKSTNRTIQQISEELDFPTQSFFGKYFKRRVGLSPLEYRKTT